MKFSALLWFMGLWSLLVYAPIAHAVWQPERLPRADCGRALDFAGGTVVHINAGIAGLVAALMMGKRRGYGHDHIVPHNLILSLIGASLLWVGWFGFNAGLGAGAANGRAGMAMAVTMLAAAAAALGLDGNGMGDLRKKAQRAGHHFGLGRGAGRDHARFGLCRFVRRDGGSASPPESSAISPRPWSRTGWATTIRWTRSACTASAASSARCLTGVFAKAAIGGDSAKGLIEGNAHQVVVQVEAVGVTIVYCARSCRSSC